MSWAEEQSWFGLEDQAMDALREQKEYKLELVGYDKSITTIPTSFSSMKEAKEAAMQYKGKFKTARIYMI